MDEASYRRHAMQETLHQIPEILMNLALAISEILLGFDSSF